MTNDEIEDKMMAADEELMNAVADFDTYFSEVLEGKPGTSEIKDLIVLFDKAEEIPTEVNIAEELASTAHEYLAMTDGDDEGYERCYAIWDALAPFEQKMDENKQLKDFATKMLVEGKVENGHLTESKDNDYGQLNAQFEKVFAMNDRAASYEGDLEGALTDAKAGNDDAEIYLLNKSKKMIFHVFWTNFIGSEASKKVIQVRIANGEFEDFLSLVYIAFEKCIKAFKPSSYDKVKIGNFQYYLGRYLKAEAISWNTKEKEDPTGGSIRPDGMTSETESKGAGTGNAWDSLVGGAEDESDLDFLEDWNDLCKDPRMNAPLSKKVSATRKDVLAKVLKGDKSIPQIADELGVTKATLYSAINFSDIMKDYNISQDEMAKTLAVNPDAILNPLKN